MRFLPVFLLLILPFLGHTQITDRPEAKRWADSVFKTLSKDERIAQLLVMRLSSMDVKSRKITSMFGETMALVKKYNIGGVCMFQGEVTSQANQLNALQAAAKTPLMISIDGEWGVGMRLIDSILPLPKQMMLGAVSDARIIYDYGQLVAAQCRRLGIHVNYAPVVDVNNNPNNPVINDRSFGEDKHKVGLLATQYMRGMQEAGIMGSAKHFPGHGDVSVDSHYDLPVINKSRIQLDTLEMLPFKQIVNEGVGSVMVGHLFIPSIDNRANRPSSLSAKNIKGILQGEIGYNGLVITDGLEMQGVKKFFPNGESSVEALIAGNDQLLLPENIPMVIAKIKAAIKKKKISWAAIEKSCYKVLLAKFQYVVGHTGPVKTENIVNDLNDGIAGMRRRVAAEAITLLARNDDAFFPLQTDTMGKDIAYIGVGINKENDFATAMREQFNASLFYFEDKKFNSNSRDQFIDSIVRHYKKVVIGVHNVGRFPANNFNLSNETVTFINKLQQRSRAICFVFGNAYAIKNFCSFRNLVLCYEDDAIVQQTAIELLQGKLTYKGTLPVTVCDNFRYGSGITASTFKLPNVSPAEVGIDQVKISLIDSIAKDAIYMGATPGCVVMAVKEGKIVWEKAYGHHTYRRETAIKTDDVFDLASLTKILCTNLAIMKLYDEGRIDLKKTTGEYLPQLKGTGKDSLLIEQLLAHEAGLEPFTPFYRETKEAAEKRKWYSNTHSSAYTIRVARNFFAPILLKDSFYQRILYSPQQTVGKYKYSDNDFIFLGMIIEKIIGKTLDTYIAEHFYEPMKLNTICFKPLRRIPLQRIVPSEIDTELRTQLLQGDVNDPGGSLMGGVAGHAGLFGTAAEVAAIMQMLLNKGVHNGKRYLQDTTIEKFTRYFHDSTRRGLGFDKPERDNDTRENPYPCLTASPLTFGHTGFTGVCAWADPAHQLVYVFLSNRLYPTGNLLLLKMNIRPKIHELIYQSIVVPQK